MCNLRAYLQMAHEKSEKIDTGITQQLKVDTPAIEFNDSILSVAVKSEHILNIV